MPRYTQIFTNYLSFKNPTPDIYRLPIYITSTPYTIKANTLGSRTYFNSSSPIAATLPAPSNTQPATSYATGSGADVNTPQFFCNGWEAFYTNSGTGLVTISGSFDVGGSVTLALGESCEIKSNGTSYSYTKFVAAGGSGSSGVSSINSLSGALNLTSTGSTVSISTSGSNINLEVAGGGSGSVGAVTTYTPTITANSGAFGGVTATGKYINVGGHVSFFVKVDIASVGSASGELLVTLPTNHTTIGTIAFGRENNATGTMMQGRTLTNNGVLRILDYKNAPNLGNGYSITMTGSYFI